VAVPTATSLARTGRIFLSKLCPNTNPSCSDEAFNVFVLPPRQPRTNWKKDPLGTDAKQEGEVIPNRELQLWRNPKLCRPFRKSTP
jgi:hypothetical protein